MILIVMCILQFHDIFSILDFWDLEMYFYPYFTHEEMESLNALQHLFVTKQGPKMKSLPYQVGVLAECLS